MTEQNPIFKSGQFSRETVLPLIDKNIYESSYPDYEGLARDLREIGMTITEIQSVMYMIRKGEL
jgi:hypothetical protein